MRTWYRTVIWNRTVFLVSTFSDYRDYPRRIFGISSSYSDNPSRSSSGSGLYKMETDGGGGDASLDRPHKRHCIDVRNSSAWSYWNRDLCGGSISANFLLPPVGSCLSMVSIFIAASQVE